MLNETNRNDKDLTRAAIPLIFEDGSELYLRPLGDRANTELDIWVKARYLHDQRSNIPKDADEETKDRIERIAQQEASTLCWFLGLGARIMVSIEGMTQILYQASREDCPEISREWIREKLFVKKNLDLANEAVAKVENLEDDLKKNRAARQKRNRQNRLRKKKGTR